MKFPRSGWTSRASITPARLVVALLGVAAGVSLALVITLLATLVPHEYGWMRWMRWMRWMLLFVTPVSFVTVGLCTWRHVKAPIEGGRVGMLAAQGDVQSAQVALSVAHVLDARAEGDLGRAAHPDLTHLGLIDESV